MAFREANMKTLEERFWSKVRKGPGCWEWKAATSNGYGNIQRDGKACYAHRVAFEMRHGKIPAGKQIDHLCRNTQCVRPSHMEAVSPRENTVRGSGPTAINAKKKFCIRGHALDKARISKSGWRRCRPCERIHAAEYRARRAHDVHRGGK